MTERNLTLARHDPTHCLAPGLFRSLKRGERESGKLDITHDMGASGFVRFIGFEPLGADDMRLLQGIVAMAGPDGLLLEPAPETEAGQQLRHSLATVGDAAERDGLMVRASMSRLLHEVGMTDGGRNIRAMKASLARMSNVTVVVTNGPRQASYNLLSYALDEETGGLLVALNPRLAGAILGDQRHVRIDMTEVRKLGSDPARLIHQRLCGWIDPGKMGRVALDTLCGYVWPDEANRSTKRKRRQRVRDALSELAALGWKVAECSRSRFEIARPGVRTNGHASPY